MLKASLDYRLVGRSLGRMILDSQGRVLLNSGVLLTSTYVDRLLRLGFSEVYIEDDRMEDVEIDDVVREETRQVALQAIAKTMVSMSSGTVLDEQLVYSVVQEILDEVGQKGEILTSLTDIRSCDNYTFAHSVNVSTLSILLGLNMKLPKTALLELGIGALLHDVGKAAVPKSLLLKPERLNPEEVDRIQQHAMLGFRALRSKRELGSLVANVAYQHHERMDGSGYPLGLRSGQIQPFGRITAVADSYDAMTSDRVYRARTLPHLAMKELKELAGLKYDPKAVQVFVQQLAPYPNGTFLRFVDHRVGVVVSQNARRPERPVAKVVQDEFGHVLERSERLDLSRHPSVEIQSVLGTKEVNDLMYGPSA